MPDRVNIDEGERLLAAFNPHDINWIGAAAWAHWIAKNTPAMLAELRDLREQVVQLTQVRDAGKEIPNEVPLGP